ncbi:hypothetical protein GBAR_LOCUS4777 [Geodia barretti]|uniref:Uncharacterized protein n=1 Tax=Geodia barretti TaxID=519541 RepID=A0AA35W3B1_GEOBA|nr:hypothetical protein GBAR_LOCUS4777 [Geodia barretti]
MERILLMGPLESRGVNQQCRQVQRTLHFLQVSSHALHKTLTSSSNPSPARHTHQKNRFVGHPTRHNAKQFFNL